MVNGYFNKKGVVDLTEKKTTDQIITDETLCQFIGGSGLATRLLYDHIDPDISSLSPESRLFIA